MDSRFVAILFDAVYTAALGIPLGLLAFFLFNQEVSINRELRDRAYRWSAIAMAAALPSFLGTPLSFPEYRGPLVGLQAMLILACVLLLLYAANSLNPSRGGDAQELKRAGSREKAVNFAVLGLGIALIVLHSARSAPRQGGIVEPSPSQRYDFMEFAKRVNKIVNDQCSRAITSKARDARSFDLDETARAELLEVSQRFWERGGSPASR